MLATDPMRARAADVAARHADAIALAENYLAAIARRDVAGVLRCLDSVYGRSFHAWHNHRDFHPLFDLWCDDQLHDARLHRATITDTGGVVEFRSARESLRLHVRRHDKQWWVIGETRHLLAGSDRVSCTPAPTPTPECVAPRSRWHWLQSILRRRKTPG